MSTPSTLKNYSVWYYRQEQWDPDAIDEPDLRCQAGSSIEAAERLADNDDTRTGEFIVRDDIADTYRQIELVRSWQIKRSWLAPKTRKGG
jgi:hypothetical protein